MIGHGIKLSKGSVLKTQCLTETGFRQIILNCYNHFLLTVVTPVVRCRKWNKRVCHVISVSTTSQKDKRNVVVI